MASPILRPRSRAIRTPCAGSSGAKYGDGFIFAAAGADAVVAWRRTQHHLSELGRSDADFGRELLTIFARDPQETADHLKVWRDGGGTHGCVASMDKGLGADIEAHIAYVAEVKRRVDAG